MRAFSLLELTRALEAQPNMPYALTDGIEERAKRTARENPEFAWLLPYLSEAVKRYQTEPVRLPSFQEYAAFDREGERHKFDGAMYELRRRLNLTALALLLDVPGARAPFEDILYATLHLPTWSLSAHLLGHSMDGYWDAPLNPFDETGRVGAPGRAISESLDLFSCGCAFGLCELAQLLEGKAEPYLLKEARMESCRRVIEPLMRLAPYPHYETNPNNWSGVCMGATGCAAIYLITDARTLAPVLMRVIESLRVHEHGYEDDGASPEGFGYWQFGFEFYLMFSELLKTRTGGRIDLMQDEKMRRVAGFGTDCCLGDALKLPFGDANWRGIYDVALRHKLGEMGIPVPPKADAQASFIAQFEHGPLLLRQLLWTSPLSETAHVHPRGALYPNSQLFMGFYRTREDSVYLLCKGGNNGESHNHNDVGNYVVIRGNQMLAADIGGGDYCREYFEQDKRYTFFAARSGGHNLPIVGGVEQQGHGSCRARAFDVVMGEAQDEIKIDLTGTLVHPALTGFTREITGERATGRVIVKDVFARQAPVEIVDRIITVDEPQKRSDGVYQIGGEAGMRLCFDAQTLNARVREQRVKYMNRDRAYILELSPKDENTETVEIRVTWIV